MKKNGFRELLFTSNAIDVATGTKTKIAHPTGKLFQDFIEY